MQRDDRRSEQQRRNMVYSEERFLLLDTIRDLISEELDHRGLYAPTAPSPEVGPEAPEETPPPQSCCPLWRRIRQIFTLPPDRHHS